MSKRSSHPERDDRPARRRRSSLPMIGWREWVALPDLHVDPVKAKVDTGARSSCLHAFDLEWFERRGEPWVRFEVHPIQRSDRGARTVECPVHEVRTVRSSNGKSERRPVIRTAIELDGEEYRVDVTLTRRDQMGFRMLLGREAVRGRFLIHAGRSYLLERPESALKPARRSVKKAGKKTVRKAAKKSAKRSAKKTSKRAGKKTSKRVASRKPEGGYPARRRSSGSSARKAARTSDR